MKKRKIITLILALSFVLFSASGCSRSILSFTDACGTNTMSVGEKESLTYSVSFKDNFDDGKYSYKKASALSSLSVAITGTYQVINEIVSSNSAKAKFNSDIIADYSSATMLKSTSYLSLSTSYNYKEQIQVYNEFIKTESYSLNIEGSLAPIYSSTEAKYAVTAYGSDELSFSTIHYNSIAKYNKTNVSLTLSTYNFDDDISIAQPIKTVDSSENFEFRTIIDNNSLIFAIRNVEWSSGSTTTIPVYSPAYKGIKDIFVYYDSDVPETCITESTTAKRVCFRRDESSQSGSEQVLYIQNVALQDSTNKAIVYKYITPISEYGTSYNCLGVLEYLLTNYSYS